MSVDLSSLDANAYAEQARPVIRRGCKRCGVKDEDIRRGAIIVSPSGLAHFGEDNGDTSCGIDATGNNWWWPL
jgi:hypothetical protein